MRVKCLAQEHDTMTRPKPKVRSPSLLWHKESMSTLNSPVQKLYPLAETGTMIVNI